MKPLKLNLTKILILPGFLFLMFIQLAGCGDSGVVAPKSDDNVSISVKKDDGAFDNPVDVILITEAKALIREIEFELEGSGIEHEIHNAAFVVHCDIFHFNISV